MEQVLLDEIQYFQTDFNYDGQTIQTILLSGQLFFKEADVCSLLRLPIDYLKTQSDLQIFRKRDMYWYISEIGLSILLQKQSPNIYQDLVFIYIPKIKTKIQIVFNEHVQKLSEYIKNLQEKITEYEFNIDLLTPHKMSEMYL